MGLAKYVVLVYFEKKNNNGVSVGRTGKQLCVEVQYFVIHRIDILLQKL